MQFYITVRLKVLIECESENGQEPIINLEKESTMKIYMDQQRTQLQMIMENKKMRTWSE